MLIVVIEIGDGFDDETVALLVEWVHEQIDPVHYFQDEVVLDGALELAIEEEDSGEVSDVAGSQILLHAHQHSVDYLLAEHQSDPGEYLQHCDDVDNLFSREILSRFQVSHDIAFVFVEILVRESAVDGQDAQPWKEVVHRYLLLLFLQCGLYELQDPQVAGPQGFG